MLGMCIRVEQLGARWNIDTCTSLPGWDRLTLLPVSASRFRPGRFEADEAMWVFPDAASPSCDERMDRPLCAMS